MTVLPPSGPCPGRGQKTLRTELPGLFPHRPPLRAPAPPLGQAVFPSKPFHTASWLGLLGQSRRISSLSGQPSAHQAGFHRPRWPEAQCQGAGPLSALSGHLAASGWRGTASTFMALPRGNLASVGTAEMQMAFLFIWPGRAKDLGAKFIFLPFNLGCLKQSSVNGLTSLLPESQELDCRIGQ